MSCVFVCETFVCDRSMVCAYVKLLVFNTLSLCLANRITIESETGMHVCKCWAFEVRRPV
ncbi:hypothetical protein HanRHA438_Chr16g0766131 [Helianthus annuus]|nr:hypothetical protein HanRHA438_Chr16g0766131 [Helianthus annuus]